MRKQLILTMAFAAAVAVIPVLADESRVTLDVSPGELPVRLYDLLGANTDALEYLKVTGRCDTLDLRNLGRFKHLRELDLGSLQIEGRVIPQRMCEKADSLRKVVLPADVTKIGDYAFDDAWCLTSVSFPAESQVEEVGRGVFDNLSKLEELYIPNVKVLGGGAFWGCRQLDLSYMRGVRSVAYHALRATGITEVPEGMFTEEITDMQNMFSSCDELKSLYIPDHVTTIRGICDGCTKLERVRVGNAVEDISQRTFAGTAISEIDLPATLLKADASAFQNCPNLKRITCRALLPPQMDLFNVKNGYFGTTNIADLKLTVSKAAYKMYEESVTGWGQLKLTEPIDLAYDNILLYEAKTLHLDPATDDCFLPGAEISLSYNYNLGGQLLVDGTGTLHLGKFQADRSRSISGDAEYGKRERVTVLNKARNLTADEVSLSTLFDQNCWHYFVMPFDIAPKDIELREFTHVTFREYDGSERAAGNPLAVWKPVSDDTVLTAGKPYAFFCINTEDNHSSWYVPKEEIIFKAGAAQNGNNLFKTGSAEYPVRHYDAEFAFDRSWNNLGNPYFCYYDIRSLIDQDGNQVTSPVFLWNGKSFVAYSPLDDNHSFAPYEAFFLQVPATVSSIRFVPEARYRYDEAVAAGLRAPAAPDPARSVFNFNLISDGNALNRTRIVITEDASAEYEPGRDAAKFFDGESAKIYVSGNANYEICERPLADGTATLGISTDNAGELTLHLDGRFVNGWKVQLTDLLTGAEADLTEGDYTFNAEGGNNAARFSVRFSPAREEEAWTVFNLENPGDLNAACEADADLALSITHLKICGTMNDYDTGRIKQMKNLVKADFSEAIYPNNRVPEYQFYMFESLQEVKLPASIQIIKPNAFYGCKSLTRFDCPDDLYYIDNSAFRECTSLSEVDFNNKLRVIGYCAFSGTTLTKVVLPESVTRIQDDAFDTYWTRSLVSIECRSMLPPDYGASGWKEGGQYYGDPYYQSYLQQVQVIVPEAVANLYRSHNGWNKHLVIRPKEMTFTQLVADREATVEVTEPMVAAVAPDIRLDLLGLYSYSDYPEYDWYEGRGQLTFEGDVALDFGSVDWRIRHHYNHGTTYSENRPVVPSVINNNPNVTASEMSLSMLGEPRFWHFISLPFDCRYEDIEIAEGNFLAVRTYDGAARAEGDLDQAWTTLKEGDIMKAGIGYALYVHDVEPNRGLQTIRFRGIKGALNTNMFITEPQTLDLKDYPSDVESDRSWNLVTNPYAAYYDISCLTDGEGNTVTTPITYRHHRSYRACSPIDDNLILYPNEPIFIQKPEQGEIHFPLEGRMHWNEANTLPGNPGLFKPADGVVDRNVFNFNVMQNDEMVDRARIVINEAALPTYESSRDAVKFIDADNTTPQLYVEGDCRYAICERPLGDATATLGLADGAQGGCTISLNGRYQTGWQVWLTDRTTGTTLDLTTADYTFTPAGDDAARFTLRFDNSGVSGVETAKVAADSIVVTDIAGLVVYRGPRAAFRAPASGLYIITDGVNTNKVFFNK